jgi:hypothetical protein
MRIERADDSYSISEKWADYSSGTISGLVEQGQTDTLTKLREQEDEGVCVNPNFVVINYRLQGPRLELSIVHKPLNLPTARIIYTNALEPTKSGPATPQTAFIHSAPKCTHTYAMNQLMNKSEKYLSS